MQHLKLEKMKFGIHKIGCLMSWTRYYSCIYLKWVHPINMAKEALDRNSWIFDADHWFSSKSHENMIFVKSYASIYLKWFQSNWNVKSYSCVYLKWVHPINVATEPLDRISWILVADHWFSSKSRENMIFWNVKSFSCM